MGYFNYFPQSRKLLQALHCTAQDCALHCQNATHLKMDHETISIYIQQKYPFFWKPGASRILLQLKTCFKVGKILEGCLDLILSSLSSVKIQIEGGKITENLGLKSSPQMVKISFVLFLFKFSIQNCISLFLTIF